MTTHKGPAELEEPELLADLNRVCNQARLFAVELRAGHLSIAAEEAYALRLGDVADGILRHAEGRKGLAIAGQPTRPTRPVVAGGWVRVEAEPRGLLAAPEPSDWS